MPSFIIVSHDRSSWLTLPPSLSFSTFAMISSRRRHFRHFLRHIISRISLSYFQILLSLWLFRLYIIFLYFLCHYRFFSFSSLFIHYFLSFSIIIDITLIGYTFQMPFVSLIISYFLFLIAFIHLYLLRCIFLNFHCFFYIFLHFISQLTNYFTLLIRISQLFPLIWYFLLLQIIFSWYFSSFHRFSI